MALSHLLGKKGFLKIKMNSTAVVSISGFSLHFQHLKKKFGLIWR